MRQSRTVALYLNSEINPRPRAGGDARLTCDAACIAARTGRHSPFRGSAWAWSIGQRHLLDSGIAVREGEFPETKPPGYRLILRGHTERQRFASVFAIDGKIRIQGADVVPLD